MSKARRVVVIPDSCVFESTPDRADANEGGEEPQPTASTLVDTVNRWKLDRTAALESLRQKLSIDKTFPSGQVFAQPQPVPSVKASIRSAITLPDAYEGTAGALLKDIEVFVASLGLPEGNQDLASKVEELHRRVMWLQPSAITECTDRLDYTRKAVEQWRGDRETVAKSVSMNSDTMKEVIKLTNFLKQEFEPELPSVLSAARDIDTLAPLYAEALSRTAQMGYITSPGLIPSFEERIASVQAQVSEMTDALETSRVALKDSLESLKLRRQRLAERTKS